MFGLHLFSSYFQSRVTATGLVDSGRHLLLETVIYTLVFGCPLVNKNIVNFAESCDELGC